MNLSFGRWLVRVACEGSSGRSGRPCGGRPELALSDWFLIASRRGFGGTGGKLAGFCSGFAAGTGGLGTGEGSLGGSGSLGSVFVVAVVGFASTLVSIAFASVVFAASFALGSDAAGNLVDAASFISPSSSPLTLDPGDFFEA